MWFDSDGAQGMTPAESAQVVQMLQTQPQIIVDPRLPGVKGDFGSAEVDAPLLRPKRDWELCGSVTASWGYTLHHAKPLKVLLPYLITAWGMGGNVLLNVGPSPQGVIPQDCVTRLREVGQWLGTYGDTIYGSTAGPFDYLPWGTATLRRSSGRALRPDSGQAREGDTIFLQIFQWPGDGRLLVPLSNTIKKATLLGPGGPQDLATSHDDPNRLIVNLPATAPDPVASVVALTLDGEPRTDYHSVLLNAPVKASAEQRSAAQAVDEDAGTRWGNPQTTGWLEFNLPKPVTVVTLRMTAAYAKISNFSLEYKEGDAWKPILKGEKATEFRGEGFSAGDCADLPREYS